MRKESPPENPAQKQQVLRKYALVLMIALIAAVGGVLVGNWLSGLRSISDERRRVDEYMGLGERTGLTGDLALLVSPTDLTIGPGEPAKVTLTLSNQGRKPLLLNDWLTPSPAIFSSNQLPLKVAVRGEKGDARFLGNGVLLPPHTKEDFFTLGPREKRQIQVDLSKAAGNGRWDMASPGRYVAEVWYETHLTGRYIGVDAWVGMTNHVIVNITVKPPSKGGSR